VCGRPLFAATLTALDFLRRVPVDTRGGSIIPQILLLRHG